MNSENGVGSALATIELTNPDGESVILGSLWERQPVALVFCGTMVEFIADNTSRSCAIMKPGLLRPAVVSRRRAGFNESQSRGCAGSHSRAGGA